VPPSDRLTHVLQLAAELAPEERAELVDCLELMDADESSPSLDADDGAIPPEHMVAIEEAINDPGPPIPLDVARARWREAARRS
jgi:hypothetical protein